MLRLGCTLLWAATSSSYCCTSGWPLGFKPVNRDMQLHTVLGYDNKQQ